MNVPPRSAQTPELADAVKNLAEGGSNAGGTVTLVPGATQTHVTNTLCTAAARVLLSPRSAAAVSSGAYVAANGAVRGGFTITHPAAAAGCVFDYELRLPS